MVNGVRCIVSFVCVWIGRLTNWWAISNGKYRLMIWVANNVAHKQINKFGCLLSIEYLHIFFSSLPACLLSVAAESRAGKALENGKNDTESALNLLSVCAVKLFYEPFWTEFCLHSLFWWGKCLSAKVLPAPRSTKEKWKIFLALNWVWKVLTVLSNLKLNRLRKATLFAFEMGSDHVDTWNSSETSKYCTTKLNYFNKIKWPMNTHKSS